MSVYWLSFATRTPPQSFSQEELFKMAGYPDYPLEERRRLQALFRASGISRRSMWLSQEDYKPSEDPDDFHSRYLSGVREIAPKVTSDALAKCGLQGRDLDFLVFASCTGYTCPGFSAELAYTLGMKEDRPTLNMLGMGCSALVPALERAWDYLVAHPGSRAVVIAAEICSATYWIDHDVESAVGNALFGDGATAIVLSSLEEDVRLGADHCTAKGIAKVEGFKTLRDGRYLSEMGFTQKQGRLKVRLAREIPERILPLVLRMVELLELPEGSRLAIHPGGRRVLDLLGTALGKQSEKWKVPLNWSKHVLKHHGNMSSPTAAFVLEQSFLDLPLAGEEIGGILTMGPGLSVEGVRMVWSR